MECGIEQNEVSHIPPLENIADGLDRDGSAVDIGAYLRLPLFGEQERLMCLACGIVHVGHDFTDIAIRHRLLGYPVYPVREGIDNDCLPCGKGSLVRKPHLRIFLRCLAVIGD